MKLNLGCGLKKLDGFINCDSDRAVKPDKLIDLAKKLPFRTSSVDEIFTSHTLEHIPQEILVNKTLPEIWRICKPNARIKIIVPYMDAQPVFDHFTRWSEESFNWCRECYKSSDTFPFKFSFHTEKIVLGKSRMWGWIYSLIPLKVWRGIWKHVIEEIRVELTVKK